MGCRCPVATSTQNYNPPPNHAETPSAHRPTPFPALTQFRLGTAWGAVGRVASVCHGGGLVDWAGQVERGCAMATVGDCQESAMAAHQARPVRLAGLVERRRRWRGVGSGQRGTLVGAEKPLRIRQVKDRAESTRLGEDGRLVAPPIDWAGMSGPIPEGPISGDAIPLSNPIGLEAWTTALPRRKRCCQRCS